MNRSFRGIDSPTTPAPTAAVRFESSRDDNRDGGLDREEGRRAGRDHEGGKGERWTRGAETRPGGGGEDGVASKAAARLAMDALIDGNEGKALSVLESCIQA